MLKWLMDRDMQLHFFAGFTLQCVLSSVIHLFTSWHHSQIISIIMVMIAAYVWEFYYWEYKNSLFENKEILASVLGAVSFILFVHLIYWKLTFFT